MEEQSSDSIIEIQPKGPSITQHINQKLAKHQEDVDSDWSLDSLEDLKALNLKDLQEQDQEQVPSEQKKNNQKTYVIKAPEKPIILANAPLHAVGKIICQVGELIIVEATAQLHNFVVDLDNWICDEHRNWIGFVMDVFGKVEKPFYAIKYEIPIDKVREMLINKQLQTVYYIEGTEKILKDEDLKSMMSKSAIDAEQGDDLEDSDDDQLKIQRDFSTSRHQDIHHRKPRFHQDQAHQEEGRIHQERSRTRDHHHNQQQRSNRWESSWQDQARKNETHQNYVQNMYTLHYQEMMKLYNGTHHNQQHQNNEVSNRNNGQQAPHGYMTNNYHPNHANQQQSYPYQQPPYLQSSFTMPPVNPFQQPLNLTSIGTNPNAISAQTWNPTYNPNNTSNQSKN